MNIGARISDVIGVLNIGATISYVIGVLNIGARKSDVISVLNIGARKGDVIKCCSMTCLFVFLPNNGQEKVTSECFGVFFVIFCFEYFSLHICYCYL